ncbi:MAG TPA: thiamine phosphate synthase [Stenomitos sp.]
MTPSNTPLYRILDANLDRAREGLRVIEEWCRFGLNRADWAGQCKGWRQQLGHWHRPEYRLARDTPADVGTALTHPYEETRTDTSAVLQANLCRIQEALRVLEEYGKVVDPQMGSACKQIRYQIYTLESALLRQARLHQLCQIKLYLITTPSERLIETVAAALQGGVKLVQYRDKNTDDGIRWKRAQALRSLTSEHGALLIINDRVDLALAVDADGVHLGQQDMPVAVARQLLGPHRLIGRSTTNPEELARALEEKVDYLGVGPAYATPTKTDKAVAGLAYIQHAAAHATLPWFAIGGIDLHTLPQVKAAGASRVAVVRAVMDATDPAAAAQALEQQLAL